VATQPISVSPVEYTGQPECAIEGNRYQLDHVTPINVAAVN
jgi:hypothetical protein